MEKFILSGGSPKQLKRRSCNRKYWANVLSDSACSGNGCSLRIICNVKSEFSSPCNAS